jgi:adenosylcobinamide-GDP ribazoletransferase
LATFPLRVPANLTAALLVAVWAGVTGLLHLDGFMDSCVGVLPPRSPERRLEIMKDSRVGAFGVVGVILLLLLKYSALAALPPAYAWTTFITVPTLARWAMTWQMAHYPLARAEGVSVFFKAGLGWPQIVGATILALVVAAAALTWLGIVLLVITWLVTILMARFAMARLTGLTGDIYGATCEVIEVALLVIVVVIG